MTSATAAGFDVRVLCLGVHDQIQSWAGWIYGERVWYSGGVSLIYQISL